MAVPSVPISTVSIPVGDWIVEPDGHRWWFDSGSFALDFAYSGPMPTGVGRERLNTPVELGEWFGARLPFAIGQARSRDLFDAVALRDAIARMVAAAAAGAELRPADVDLVNLYAATPDIPPSLGGGSRQAGRSVQSVAQSLSTIARDAVGLFDPANEGRIRICEGQCGYLFLDTSRAGTRRWCSMQRCGNRAKVRAHRARKAKAAEAAGHTTLYVDSSMAEPMRTLLATAAAVAAKRPADASSAA
ncbi:CGNR zinc finger domain-containing protein [Agromyces seonyuensis]|uniref:Zinc finger CGNR domain-containing protein n=1 Tax=Agromyces seonyuensis TaxID=2662446 RepID=A0A6I4P179_9MICO|nr:CGNR zinc finger domain-containing protein [Agromyces seonyuensis]MWC00307.1 hypothetical protein [Agromyces seonyuensis]